MPFNEFLRRLLAWDTHLPTCRKLKRSAAYKVAYKKWVTAQVYLHWTGSFHKAYHYRKAGLAHAFRVQLIEEENRKGAIFFHDPAISTENFNFLFDFLKDRVLELNYRLHSMDALENRHARYKEQVEKYFLLPPASDVPGGSLCNQLYGNITLDYIKINSHPGYIRLRANTYTDPYFSKPQPFMDLLDKLFRPDEQHREQK